MRSGTNRALFQTALTTGTRRETATQSVRTTSQFNRGFLPNRASDTTHAPTGPTAIKIKPPQIAVPDGRPTLPQWSQRRVRRTASHGNDAQSTVEAETAR